MISGGCDGEVRIWNLAGKKTLWASTTHKGFVNGLAVAAGGGGFLSCGQDKTVKLWNFDFDAIDDTDFWADTTPALTFLGKHVFNSLDANRSRPLFATASLCVDVWDHNRSEPIQSIPWGTDTVTSVRFNPVETNVLASTASDRSIALYDIRSESAIKKVILKMKTNAIAWNPMEAFNFVAANEDHNIYTYDMRKMDMALNVHKDHVSAVMDVDFSPTGREFVTGGYDRTVRLFKYNEGRSREVYHGRRMQRIFCVQYSGDARYVLSGSDDTNIRLWKSRASEKLGTVVRRQKSKAEYQTKLKERFKNLPEIKRISRHRHLPKAIFKASQLKLLVQGSRKRKEANVRRHSKAGSVPFKAERKKHHVTMVD